MAAHRWIAHVLVGRTAAECRAPGFRPAQWMLTTFALAALLSAGCGSVPEEAHERAPGKQESPAKAPQALKQPAPPVSELVGKDGNVTVSAANTVLNQYAALGANAAVGATTISVTNAADLDSAQFGPLEAGDLLMIYQAQGASISTTNNAQYGAIGNLNNAGRYEIVSVVAINGNVLTIDALCGGLKHDYTAAAGAQVIRVPQITDLTVNMGASVVATQWNGTRGGIVALHVTGTAQIDGTIDVSAMGFRGGAVDNDSQAPGSNITTFRSGNSLDGGEKGESIAGSATTYDTLLSGRFGRGAPANGGGGGNAHNAGGGGGANGNNGNLWTGAGVMDPTAAFLQAWMLDPAYAGGLANSSGGGRGGYTYSGNNGNALTQAPGNNAAWGGDARREVGGWGGRPLANDPTGRLFFGGGGGAGDGNNNAAGAGGRGGGLVMLLASTVSGGGSILANGAAGQSATAGSGNDAPGGGGAGGTVVVQANTLGGVSVSANGGNGGNQVITLNNEGEGPGGGGSGGYIALAGGVVTTSVSGGNNGTTNSTGLTEFIPNGATRGAAGNAGGSAVNLAVCLDTTAPDTSIPTAEPNPTNDPTGDFVFASTEPNSTFQCQIDGGGFQPCPENFTTPALADGSHTIEVFAIDSVGNADPTPATYTWVVDTQVPDTSIPVFEPNPTNDSTGEFTFASTEPGSTYQCRIDGGAFGPCPENFTTPALPDGSHTIEVFAVDGAGNADPTPATYTWVVDTQVPDTSIPVFEPNPTNDSTGEFTFASTEPGSTYQCRIDGGPFGPCPENFTTPALPDGSHTIEVFAVDGAGNADPTPATYTWTVDAAPPETTISVSEPNPTSDPSGEFVFTSNEPGSTFQCQIDGGGFVPCPANFTTPNLPDGSHTIEVFAIDPGGNADPTPATYTWVVDTQVPDTSIPVFEPNPTNDSTGEFTFASTEPGSTYQCRIDGGAFGPCPENFTTPALPDGSHTIEVFAIDGAGNADPTPATYTWVVDTVAPDTSIPVFEPNPTNDPSGEFTFASTEPGSTYECRIDGAAFGPCPENFTTANLPDGPHTIEVRAVDSAGNADPTPATYTWTVDSGPPDTSIPVAEPNPTNDPSGEFTFASTEPGSTYECRIDGAAFGPCPENFTTANLPDGPHTIEVRATDSLGNTDPTPATYTWVVDTTPPDTSIVMSEPNPTTDPTGDFVFGSTEPGSTYECSIDGGPFGPCPENFSTLPLSLGSHTIEVRATDPAGNTDPSPATYTWDVVEADSDNDGWTDNQETSIGTDPNDADSDNDGVLDGEELDGDVDTDGDGLINALDPDSDNDGLLDGTEMGKDCSNPDTDASVCVADGDMGATTTDPLDADTDDGGVSDGAEDADLDGVLDSGETNPTAGNGADDTMVTDSDMDGLSDMVEVTIGTDPNDADSDDDGVIDGDEPNPSIDSDGDGLINSLDPDSDNDGLLDGTEMGKDCSNPDTDAMQCVPDGDGGATTTDPLDADTDDGGVIDGAEDADQDGVFDTGETNPTAGNGADDSTNVDSDGDGLPDVTETQAGTDPNDADSDDDGVIDGLEPNWSDDTDGDGQINALDSDSDNDGLFDGTEMGLDCGNSATDPNAGQCIADGDMGATTTSPVDPDTDDGGVSDGNEDANHNGVIDAGETNPNDPADDMPGTGGAGGMGAGGGGTGGMGMGGAGGAGGAGGGEPAYYGEGSGLLCAVPEGVAGGAGGGLAGLSLLGGLGMLAARMKRRVRKAG